ncbi:MAG: prefoldin subunit beta [Candidatus Micrarchaeota archaeon]|nr:prefoldin subunit beta [Candidatus Micrarchaeota archaeon]
MAEPLRDSQTLQSQLGEFQDLQRQYQFMVSQRQQLSMQVEEIKMAEDELAKAEKGGSIYQAIGGLLMETTKADASSTLKERKELFETRITILVKQEEKIRPKLEDLRNKLEAALSQNKVSR